MSALDITHLLLACFSAISLSRNVRYILSTSLSVWEIVLASATSCFFNASTLIQPLKELYRSFHECNLVEESHSFRPLSWSLIDDMSRAYLPYLAKSLPIFM